MDNGKWKRTDWKMSMMCDLCYILIHYVILDFPFPNRALFFSIMTKTMTMTITMTLAELKAVESRVENI